MAVAIPAYEAEATLGNVVRRALASGLDVLVVDDGSSDMTSEVAREAGARLLGHPENKGKGRALQTAFTDLFGRGFEAVITLDADGQHSPEEIPRLLDAAREGADLILGVRQDQFQQMSWARRSSNRASSWAISRLAGVSLADTQTGFRLYTRRLIEVAGFPEARFEAESAILIRAARLGFRIISVPVRLDVADGRATSHYRPILDSFRIVGAVMQARLETHAWAQQRSS